MDVIFTIVSRNYAAQAATLMESLARAEPDVRRVVVATDGPIPQLEALAEVIDATRVGAPFAAMSVYYDALELNTAVKPHVFGHLLAQPGVTSAPPLNAHEGEREGYRRQCIPPRYSATLPPPRTRSALTSSTART